MGSSTACSDGEPPHTDDFEELAHWGGGGLPLSLRPCPVLNCLTPEYPSSIGCSGTGSSIWTARSASSAKGDAQIPRCVRKVYLPRREPLAGGVLSWSSSVLSALFNGWVVGAPPAAPGALPVDMVNVGETALGVEQRQGGE